VHRSFLIALEEDDFVELRGNRPPAIFPDIELQKLIDDILVEQQRPRGYVGVIHERMIWQFLYRHVTQHVFGHNENVQVAREDPVWPLQPEDDGMVIRRFDAGDMIRLAAGIGVVADYTRRGDQVAHAKGDRKSTRLNSSHVKISYAVFC